MHDSECPSRLQLQSFVNCRLPEDQAEGISEHLETCEKCESLVTSYEQDRKQAWSGPAVTPTYIYQDAPEFQELVRRAALTQVDPDSIQAGVPVQAPEIPGYRILRLIDRGGMGAVFEAIHLESERRAAIKVLHDSADQSAQALRIFMREADILSQLTHPSIVRFEGVGKCRNSIFIAMEYIDTIDITRKLWSASIEKRVRLGCGLVCQILGALEFVHQKGLVHRDIKPSNILVTMVDGKVLAKLSDFGLAKNFETAGFSGITREGEARGTLGYMAPEQFADSRGVKPSADLYSVAVTLFHYLTGKLPFRKFKNPAEAAQVLRLPPTRLIDLVPEAPGSLSEIIEQAVKWKPEDRFPSAASFRQSLMRFVRSSKS